MIFGLRLWGRFHWDGKLTKKRFGALLGGGGGRTPEEPSRKIPKDPTRAAVIASNVDAPKAQVNYKNEGFTRCDESFVCQSWSRLELFWKRTTG